MQKLLSDTDQRMLSKRGSAVVDARTNTLFVQDTPRRLEEVRKLIAQIDVPVRQVMIEARIVEATDTFSKNLGARLGFTTRPGRRRRYRLSGGGARHERPAGNARQRRRADAGRRARLRRQLHPGLRSTSNLPADRPERRSTPGAVLASSCSTRR